MKFKMKSMGVKQEPMKAVAMPSNKKVSVDYPRLSLSSKNIEGLRDVKVGDVVKQGDVIGAVGATGRATGPHLHWGMSWFDVRIDPLLVLERSK